MIHFNWGLHDLCYRNPITEKSKDKVDGRISTTLEEYAVNLETLVVRLKASGAKLIWATTTPVVEGEPGRFAGDAMRFNEVARPIMERHGVVIDDLHAQVLPRVKELQRPNGNVHFKPAGQAFLARCVAMSIGQELGIEVPGIEVPGIEVPGIDENLHQ